MKLFRLVSLFFLLFTGFFTLAQDKEEVIQHIRDRYYRINGGGLDLEQYQVGELKVTEENDQIVIIKEPTADGVFEYYFDGAFKSKRPYFVYFASKDKNYKPDLRLYLSSKLEIVWYKENQEEIDLGFYEGPYELILKAVNAFNTVKYRNKGRSAKAKSILTYIDSVDKMRKVRDTLNYESYPNEGNFSRWHFSYTTAGGKKVMEEKGQGGEHGSSQEITYFKDDQKILTISEGSVWLGFFDASSVNVTFYENGNPFRAEDYNSYGENVSTYSSNSTKPTWFDRSKMVPEVIVY